MGCISQVAILQVLRVRCSYMNYEMKTRLWMVSWFVSHKRSTINHIANVITSRAHVNTTKHLFDHRCAMVCKLKDRFDWEKRVVNNKITKTVVISRNCYNVLHLVVLYNIPLLVYYGTCYYSLLLQFHYYYYKYNRVCHQCTNTNKFMRQYSI